MNQYEYQPFIEPQTPQNNEMNTMGLVGMILGITAFMFGGITSIPGLIFSIKGMKHPSNGFAIAGLVLNIVGVLIMLFWVAYLLFIFVIFGFMIWTGVNTNNNLATPSPIPPAQVANEPNMLRSQALVQTYFILNGSVLPTPEEFALMAGDQINDSYGTPLTYLTFDVVDDEYYQIMSNGPDKINGTDDDFMLIVYPHNPPTHSQSLPLIRDEEVDIEKLKATKKEEAEKNLAPGEVPLNPLE